MIVSDAYFENIQSVIQNELLMAKRSVYAAVAWFTDDLLFETLLELKQRNVEVQLCVVRDEINFRVNGLSFEKLQTDNSKFFAAESDKMHHKFCVIDENVVITGSYNWTYRAANAGKDENIIITSGDTELAKKFVQEFLKLTNQQNDNSTTDLTRILKRCKTILHLLELDDVEDVHRQANRLKGERYFLEIADRIANLLIQNQFVEATKEIKSLLIRYQGIEVYVDPLIQALKLEIQLLEYQIIALEAEKTEAEKCVFEYDRVFNEVLGETVKEYLFLKQRLKEKIKEEQPQNETAQQDFEEAQKDYADYERTYKETKAETKNFIELTNAEDRTHLKKMYREAAALCHPDKFVNDRRKQEEAEAIFKELSNAYQKQDIEKVEAIWKRVKVDGMQMAETNTLTNEVDKLQKTLDKLRKKYEELAIAVKAVVDSEAFKTLKANSDLQSYFTSLKRDIEKEILTLKEKLESNE